MDNITYVVGNGLYVNITNRCGNRCAFCIRSRGEGVGTADSLWLDREPTREEALADIERRGVENYDELVFCGFGEPLERAEDVVWISAKVKEKHKLPIRVNTNGQADLLLGRPVAPLLAGVVDSVSVSLNAPDAASYNKLCRPDAGDEAFDALLRVTEDCAKVIPEVTLSVVDVIKPGQIEACRAIAQRLGVHFRVRHMWDTPDDAPATQASDS